MKETAEIKIGEKVIEVDPVALRVYLSLGEDATKAKIDRYEFAGDDKLAGIYKDRLDAMKPLIKALDDYIIER